MSSLSMRRVLAIIHARNLEFVRDRGTLGWNILMPLLLVLGLGLVMSGDGRPLFTVAIDGAQSVSHPVSDLRYADTVSVDSIPKALEKLKRHQFDLVVDLDMGAYWVNDSSPKGYVLAGIVEGLEPPLRRLEVTGEAIRYIDWLLPGILGMNMMFSCLFGVGYVIVRYRKSGYLKRLNATPTTALDFLVAQVISRLALVMTVTVLVFIAAMLMLQFTVQGEWLLLLGVTALGAAALVAMGLAIAARVASEELANGLLNLLAWPMMILSGVWFSIEGSPDFVQQLALWFPLTHLLEAARAVMLDGADALAIMDHIIILSGMTIGFLLLGALLFRWRAT